MFRFGLTSYNNDFVILDVMRDEFSIVPDIIKNDEWRVNKDILLKTTPDLSSFFVGSHFIGTAANSESDSFLEERWIMPMPVQPSQAQGLLKKCLLLVRVIYLSRQITRKGMSWIFSQKKQNEFYQHYSEQEKIKIVDCAINRLSEIFNLNLFKTDCLTFSYALKKMIEAEKISAKLVIGIRTQPFYSHAWVEVDGHVINDDKLLRQKLSVIAEI